MFSQSTGIGKTINGLRHNNDAEIADLANSLVQKWKEEAKKQTEEAKVDKPVHRNSNNISKGESNKHRHSELQTNHKTEHGSYQSNLNKHISDKEISRERKLKKMKQSEKVKHELKSKQHKETIDKREDRKSKVRLIYLITQVNAVVYILGFRYRRLVSLVGKVPVYCVGGYRV